jgi:hypothetical protein
VGRAAELATHDGRGRHGEVIMRHPVPSAQA